MVISWPASMPDQDQYSLPGGGVNLILAWKVGFA